MFTLVPEATIVPLVSLQYGHLKCTTVMSSENSDLMDSFQRQQSVWNLVKENVPGSELPEVRAVLGDTLIDTYTELYSEVEMWERIWQELHYSEHGRRPEAPMFPLADPPAVKELLKAEIQLLLLTLREKAARDGRDEEEVMAQYNPSVVTYALSSTSTQKQGSPGRWCEEKSPSRPPSSQSETGSRSVSSLSSHSSCEEEIKALRDKLNITHIDEVVTHLRPTVQNSNFLPSGALLQTLCHAPFPTFLDPPASQEECKQSVLTEESEALRRDVRVLQESLETERVGAQTEPSLAELKEERRLIQRDLNVQSLKQSYNTNNQSTGNTQIHAREIHQLVLSANDLEKTKLLNITVPHLKPCPPKDKNHIRNDQPLMSFSSAESTISIFAPEHGDKECKYRGNSIRASAFRLVPAASGRASGPVEDFLMKVTGNGDQQHLQPVPPAVQRTANRGQRGSRQLCFPQPDTLLTSP